ncbi:MAG: SDR family NAD(P)-dependent oxidoreductase [Gammaproteobacteria bacterium]
MSDARNPDLRGTRLAGKVAIVVGGGSTGDYPGTGSAMARLFAAQGARVAVVGRSTGHTARTVDAIVADGGMAHLLLGDALQRADCERFAGETVERYGRIDVVVNNLAVHRHVDVEALDESAWEHIWAGNLKAPMLMTQFVIPHMRAAGGGSIINIGSIAGTLASGAIGYGTAKGGLTALTRDMAMVLGRDGIRVNCVIPGHLHTPHVGRVSDGEARRLRADLNMLGIEGDGWDAAFAALYFACDESRFVTGQCLTVDAGVTGILGMTQVVRLSGRR